MLTVKEVSLPKSYLVLNNDLRRTYNTLSLGIVMLFNPSATKNKVKQFSLFIVKCIIVVQRFLFIIKQILVKMLIFFKSHTLFLCELKSQMLKKLWNYKIITEINIYRTLDVFAVREENVNATVNRAVLRFLITQTEWSYPVLLLLSSTSVS